MGSFPILLVAAVVVVVGLASGECTESQTSPVLNRTRLNLPTTYLRSSS